MASNGKGRPYNGITGLELKTLVLTELRNELAAEQDPVDPATGWRKQMAIEIDRRMSLDDHFRVHLAYPVIEWAWALEVEGRPGEVRWSFTLKAAVYPSGDSPEWTFSAQSGVHAPRPAMVPVFELSIGFGREYQPADTLRKAAGLPVPGTQASESGRVDLTGDQAEQQLASAKRVIETF